MTVFLCVVLALSALIHVASALVIVERVSALISFIKNDPERHPVRRYFARITRREQVRRAGIPMRAA